MATLIDADALQEEFKKSHDGKRLMLIDTAPAVDAVEVVRGKPSTEQERMTSDECQA